MDFIEELKQSLNKPKRMKVKTLIKKFGFVRRSEEAMLQLTELLQANGIMVNPPVLKLGDQWGLGLEDWVYLSLELSDLNLFELAVEVQPISLNSSILDDLASKELRTEKEVETKFIIPLLFALGYSEADRYDDMSVSAAIGSKPTTLRIDFALFNSELDYLNNQVLLIVEAKHENRLIKQQEIVNARNQAKCYALWTGCSVCLITDGNLIEVFSLPRTHLEQETTLFSCARSEFSGRFEELYRLISKESLSKFYSQRFRANSEM